jgi:hypothetical protein
MNLAKLALCALAALALTVGTSNAEVVATYQQPKRQDFQAVSADFQRAHLLERIADFINRTIRVPGLVTLTMNECGQPNAFYRPEQRTIVLCYELLEDVGNSVRTDFRGSSFETMGDVVGGTLMFVTFHELGHALVHVLDVPIFAREEDVADAISTYFMLHFQNRMSAIVGAGWFNDRGAAQLTNQQFGNEHSLGPQRKFNVMCLAVGNDPTTFSALAERAGLPRERAVRCATEYARLDSAVHKQLGRFLVH